MEMENKIRVKMEQRRKREKKQRRKRNKTNVVCMFVCTHFSFIMSENVISLRKESGETKYMV